MEPIRLAALIVFETSDERLRPDAIDVSTVASVTAVRAAVVAALPDLIRVVAVFEEAEAQFMVRAHEAAMDAAGMGDRFFRPPGAYRSPADIAEAMRGKPKGRA